VVGLRRPGPVVALEGIVMKYRWQAFWAIWLWVACSDEAGDATRDPRDSETRDAEAADFGADSGDGEAPDTLPTDTSESDTAQTDAPSEDPSADTAPLETPPDLVIGAWNLRHFSPYGVDEFRIDDIANRITILAPDVLGLEELEVAEGTDGSPPQAWDALLEALPDYAGVHAPWDLNDSTVGLLYRPDVVTLVATEILFEDDWWAFPRPPLVAELRAERDDASVALSVIVLHLKAFGDDESTERRLAACQALDDYIAARPEREFVVIGDYNDDPHDAPGENIFTDNFLDTTRYVFVTAALPPETSTSLGWYHEVDGEEITGELLDHAVMTVALHGRWDSVVPVVDSVAPADYDDFDSQYSDHFPLLLQLGATAP
jgi:endonuclease/exonuclease/phosphatase family metal-dependent hydrolase